MEIQQLRYFEMAAKYENMTRASEVLNIAQPAVSQSISRLEEELEVQLFERKGKRIRLNREGEYFLNCITPLLSSISSLKKDLVEFSGEASQHIRLLIQSSVWLIPPLLSTFREKYPKTEFSLLQEGDEYDICISSTTPFEKRENDILLLEEELYMAVPTRSTLSHFDTLKLNELGGEDFISYGKGKAIRKITDYYCEMGEIKPNIVFECDTPGAIRGLIESGLGIGFYPQYTWGPLSSPHATLRTIGDMDCRRYIICRQPSLKCQNPIVQEFIDHTIQFYNKLID